MAPEGKGGREIAEGTEKLHRTHASCTALDGRRCGEPMELMD